jgi:hypothetical protein
VAEIRYHLDEHMRSAVAVGLRRRGIDVTTTIEAGLMRASDQEQLAFAFAHSRVFVTRDRRILASAVEGVPHAGIVIARTGRGVIGPTVLGLAHMHRRVSAEQMIGLVEYL